MMGQVAGKTQSQYAIHGVKQEVVVVSKKKRGNDAIAIINASRMMIASVMRYRMMALIAGARPPARVHRVIKRLPHRIGTRPMPPVRTICTMPAHQIAASTIIIAGMSTIPSVRAIVNAI
jgi:hypothetical protein